MTKRLLNLRRDYKAVFTQLLGPVLFVLVALSIQGVRPHATCIPSPVPRLFNRLRALRIDVDSRADPIK